PRSRPARERVEACRHAGLNADERRIVAGSAQCPEIGLGEALIASREIVRKRDVADRSAAVPANHRARDVVEARALARPDVEDSRDAAVEQPEVHAHDVFDVDEVAPLLPRSEAVELAEQPRLALCRDLAVQMMDDAR